MNLALLLSQATEAAIRSKLIRGDVFQLAKLGYAHPVCSGAFRLYLTARSAAAGTKEPDPGNDGLLEAREISSQVTTHANMVMLVACETNLGAMVCGEGTNRFTRSLLQAGARFMLASGGR